MSGVLIAIITGVHVVVCVALMASILLQSGKGGGLAGAFGAGSSQTLFGGRGAASFLSRATTICSIIFFVTSLTLGLSASSGRAGSRSLIQKEAQRRAQQQRTAVPGGAPATPVGTPAGTAPGGPTSPDARPVPAAPAPAGTTAPAATPGTSGTPAPAGGTTK